MDNAQSERREITYTVMRGWRDGEGMRQHRNGVGGKLGRVSTYHQAGRLLAMPKAG